MREGGTEKGWRGREMKGEQMDVTEVYSIFCSALPCLALFCPALPCSVLPSCII
jgi:hypothetical protein